MVPDIAGDSGRARYGVVETELRPARGFLKVGYQHPAAGVDTEEVVHVQVRRGIRLSATLGHQRDHRGEAAGAGRRGHSSAVAAEPCLDGEVLDAEGWCRAERDVIVGPVEVDGCSTRDSRRCGGLARRRRGIAGGVDGLDRIEVLRPTGDGVVNERGRSQQRPAVERLATGGHWTRVGAVDVVAGEVRLRVGVPAERHHVRSGAGGEPSRCGGRGGVDCEGCPRCPRRAVCQGAAGRSCDARGGGGAGAFIESIARDEAGS